MKWHKVEDYPVGSKEYVLVGQVVVDQRENSDCFVARLKNGCWRDKFDFVYPVQSADRWCHIDLPED